MFKNQAAVVSEVSVVSVASVSSAVVSPVTAGSVAEVLLSATSSALRHVHLESESVGMWMSPLSRLSRRISIIAWLSIGESSSELTGSLSSKTLPGRYAQLLEITILYFASVPLISTLVPLMRVMLTISISGSSTVPLLLYSKVRPDT